LDGINNFVTLYNLKNGKMKNLIVMFVSLIFLVSCITNKRCQTTKYQNNVISEDTSSFDIDTTYNPMETHYILTDGTIIDGVELEKRIIDAWNKTFGNLTEEEKKSLLIDDFKISFDTLNQK
jgi:hypothetical protein